MPYSWNAGLSLLLRSTSLGHCLSGSCQFLFIVQGLRQALLFWCLTNQLHKLIKLWSDDDLGATVALLANSSTIGCYRIVFTTTTCCKTLWINAKLGLEILHYA